MASATMAFQVTCIRNGTDGKTYQPIRIREWDDIPVNTSTGSKWDTIPDECKIWDGLEDSPYTDIVFTIESGKRVFYRCIQSCTRDPGRVPSESYYQYHLRQASSYDMVATKVILAEQGAIGLLATNAINLFDADGNQRGQMKGIATENDFLLWLGGALANPTFGVSGTGHAYFGGTTGQRIEIDPTERTMRVYNSSNQLVATHSGRTITLEDAVPGAGTAGTRTASVAIPETTCPSAPSGYYSNTGNSAALEGTYTGNGSATIKVSVPAMRMYGKLDLPASGAYCEVELRAVVYINNSKRSSVQLGKFNAIQGSFQASDTTAKTLTCSILKGESYKVRLELTGRVYAPSGQYGHFYASSIPSGSSTYSVELIAQGYRCEYGANGWVISYDSQNYEYCLVINGILYRKIVSGGKTILTT
ncbi:MAG: hypothetical protein K2G69_04405 [Muribaculaceae bacterium]|nr:hypothetical protein [Muribaculaceae bacterium]